MRYLLFSLLLACTLLTGDVAALVVPVEVIAETPEQVTLLLHSDTLPTVEMYWGTRSRIFGGSGVYTVTLYGWCPSAAINTSQGNTFYFTVYTRPCVYLPAVQNDPV